MNTDSRYPYTYCADYIRMIVGHDDSGNTKLSRGDAAKIKRKLAEIIGMPEKELAEKIADAYLEQTK